jgi:hypothetical protein
MGARRWALWALATGTAVTVVSLAFAQHEERFEPHVQHHIPVEPHASFDNLEVERREAELERREDSVRRDEAMVHREQEDFHEALRHRLELPEEREPPVVGRLHFPPRPGQRPGGSSDDTCQKLRDQLTALGMPGLLKRLTDLSSKVNDLQAENTRLHALVDHSSDATKAPSNGH